MVDRNLYARVRRAIMEQKEPFCISDLYDSLKDITDNRDLILECLNEKYEAGLIHYVAIEEGRWAYVVS